MDKPLSKLALALQQFTASPEVQAAIAAQRKRCATRGCGQLNNHSGRCDGPNRQPITTSVPSRQRQGGAVTVAGKVKPKRAKPRRDPQVAENMRRYRAHQPQQIVVSRDR